jgi:mono/diheme cytochrome c family protein
VKPIGIPHLALLLAAGLATLASGASAQDGKTLFMAQKCNLCHSVQTAGIERVTKSEKVAGPELTDLAAKADPAFLAKYLKKEDVLNGKKHSKLFSGTDAELKAVIAWLQQQKKK